MLKEIFNTIETSYEGINNLKTFFISVYNGEFKGRDAEINQRFQQYESQKAVAPEVHAPKMGVSGFAGAKYKNPVKTGKHKADKSLHNGARHH